MLAISSSALTLAGKSGVMRVYLAYIDPGSGALLWQMITAAVVGALFYIKKVRLFFATIIRRIFKKD